MLDEHRAKKAAKEYHKALSTWQVERDAHVHLIDVAEHFEGTGAENILLKPGEAVFCQVAGAGLIEERRGPGRYQGSSHGVSIPVATIGGRSVRYRVGANKGHFVQGAPTPTAIDTGTVFVTNQRVIFQGGNQTRECAFAKLIGLEHDDAAGSTTFSVSNRQKPTTVHYGPEVSGTFDFRCDLALAHFRGTVDAFVADLRKELDELDRHRPPQPADRRPGPSAVGSGPPSAADPPPPDPAPAEPVATVSAGWYPDPWKQAALRWWDGTQWTGNVHDEVSPPE